jgi:hypothetical protein
MENTFTAVIDPKPRHCSQCDEIFNVAELSDYLLHSERKKIKCFNCKTYSHLKNPTWLKLMAVGFLFSPFFFAASIPSLIAIALLIDYLGGNWSGRQVGIVFLFPACLSVTYILSRYIMRLIRFYFFPLEPIQT